MNKIHIEKPTLIIVAGVAGSGKGYFSKEITRRVWDCVRLDKDTINTSFLATHKNNDLGYILNGPETPGNSEYFKKNVKFQSYYCLLMLALDCFQVKKHPLLDAPYTREIQNGYLDEVLFPFFKEHNIKDVEKNTKIVLCYASPEIIEKRLKERDFKRDSNKLISKEDFNNFLKVSPFIPSNINDYNHIKIDTSSHPEKQEKNIRKTLDYLLE